MAVPIEPINGHVVAKPKKQETQTKSGLYLTAEKSKNDDYVITVVAVAKDVTHIKVGDQCVRKYNAGTTVSVDGEDYILVPAEDILAKITE